MGNLWNIIKEMSGRRVSNKIPALTDKGNVATTDMEKANLLGKVLARVHSGDHLTNAHKQRKEVMNDSCCMRLYLYTHLDTNMPPHLYIYILFIS